MTIQRYHSWNSEDDEDGHYVAYDDYAELESAHKAALLTISQITDVVGTSDTLSISQQVAALAHRCNALAAENARLKDINAWCKTDAFKNMYREFKTAEALGCPDVDCMHDAMLVAIMHAPSTPATDAFLAKVRAQGVEMFVRRLQLFIDDGDFDSDELGLILGAVDCGKEFSALLRKEAGNGQ